MSDKSETHETDDVKVEQTTTEVDGQEQKSATVTVKQGFSALGDAKPESSE